MLPVAGVALKILNVRSVIELVNVIAAVGLAENLASLNALVASGIQDGHIRLHACQSALTVGVAATMSPGSPRRWSKRAEPASNAQLSCLTP